MRFVSFLVVFLSSVAADTSYFDVPVRPYILSTAGNSISFVDIVDGTFNLGSSSGGALTHYNQSDAGLHFEGAPVASGDGTFVVFSTSYQGANPLSAIKPPLDTLVVVKVDGTRSPFTVEVPEGASVHCALSATSVVFVRGSFDVLLIDVESHSQTLLLTAQGTVSEVVCSPGGDRIAFTVTRGSSHSFVANYRLGDAQFHPVLASADFDGQPAFSPSGEVLAFVRRRFVRDCFNNLTRIDYRVLTDQPAQLYHGDAYNFQDYGDLRLTWLDEESVVFPQADSGRVHLGLASATRYIDPQHGEQCDVFNFFVKSGSIYFTHNCDVAESRSLSVLSADGTIQSLFRGTQIEEFGVAERAGFSHAVLSNGTIVCLKSSFNVSGEIVTQQGVEFVAPLAIPRASSFVAPRLVRFGSNNVSGLLYLPDNASPPFKATIFSHGGPNTITTVGVTADSYYSWMVGLHAFLAQQGVATLAINYRCSIGFGVQLSCANNNERLDIIAGAHYLRSLSQINATNGVGIHGLSYGAWNAYSALAFAPELFSVGVGISGVSNRVSQQKFVDQNGLGGGRLAMRNPPLAPGDMLKFGPFADQELPGYSERVELNRQKIFESSPASRLASWRAPTLIVCSGADASVPVSLSIALYHQLEALGVATEFHLFPQAVHSGDTGAIFRRMGTLISQFILKHLGEESIIPEEERGFYPLCSSNKEKEQLSLATMLEISVVVSLGLFAVSICAICGLSRKQKANELGRY